MLCTLFELMPKFRMLGHEATKVRQLIPAENGVADAAALIVSRSECTEEGDTTDQKGWQVSYYAHC
jgi:hypothetical protein